MDGEAGGWQSPPAASQNAGGDGSNGRRDKGKGGKKALIGILVFLLVAAVGTAGFFVIRTLLGGQEEQEEITAWNNDDGEGEDALTDEQETVPQEESGSGEDGTDASGGEPFEAGSAPVSYTHLDVYKRQCMDRGGGDVSGTDPERNKPGGIPARRKGRQQADPLRTDFLL